MVRIEVAQYRHRHAVVDPDPGAHPGPGADEHVAADRDALDVEDEVPVLRRDEMRVHTDPVAEDRAIADAQEAPVRDLEPGRPVHGPADRAAPRPEPQAEEPGDEAQHGLQGRHGEVEGLELVAPPPGRVAPRVEPRGAFLQRDQAIQQPEDHQGEAVDREGEGEEGPGGRVGGERDQGREDQRELQRGEPGQEVARQGHGRTGCGGARSRCSGVHASVRPRSAGGPPGR